MTSRRAQVRTLLSSMPLDLDALGGSGGGSSHDSTGPRDAIVSRTESYLAAVDVWATRGNQKALSRVGPGVVAVCAWLAFKNLGSASSSSMTAFQKKSGLPPTQFESSAQQLSAGIKSVRSANSISSPASSAPSTPRHRDRVGAGLSTSNASTAALAQQPQDRTPEALAKRARDVMSGAAFGFSSPSSSSAHAAPSVSSARSTPKTPSGRIIKQASQASSSRDVSLSPSSSRTTLRAPEQQQQHASAMPHTPSRRSRLREQADLSSSATNGDRPRRHAGQEEEDEEEDEEEEDEDDNDEEADEGLDSDEEEALQRGWTQRREAEEQRQDQSGKRRLNEYDFARTFDEGDEEVFSRLDGDIRARKRLKRVQVALARMIQEREDAGDEAEEPASDDIFTTVSIEL